jgi:hypothetical protein
MSAGDAQPTAYPQRPALTTPPDLQSPTQKRAERRSLRAQPLVGLVGIVFAAAAFVVLAIGTGHIEGSLRVFGPLATFALTPIAMIAFWWDDWPGTRLRAPWSGLIDTLLVIVLAVALTIVAETVVERFDIASVFLARDGHPNTFAATLPLGGVAFAAMLQLTLVSEGWPLRRLGRIRSGVAALIVSWAIALAAYLLAVNTNAVPDAVRAASGLRNPGGPFSTADFGGALVVLGVWQSLFFIGLRGWPFAGMASRAARLIAGNVVVLCLGAATYLGLRDLADWRPGMITAVCGCAVSAVLVVAMLFEGWPGTLMSKLPGRTIDVILMAGVTAAVYFGFSAFADSVNWAHASSDEWVTTAALTFLGAGVILHVAIGRRWPIARRTS